METYRNLCEISFSMYLTQCHCFCRHCKGIQNSQTDRWAPGTAMEPLTFSECRDVMETFRRWRDKNGFSGIRLNFGESECSDYPEIADRIRYACSLNRKFKSLVMCNGMRIRPEDEMSAWLHRIREAGAKEICTTIYGIGDEHDRFAGRKGDFDFLVLLNKLAAEAGLTRMHVVFFSRSRIRYLEQIHDVFSALPGKTVFQYRPFYGEIQNEFFQSERISRREYENLPGYVKNHTLYKLRTQAEWRTYFLRDYRDPLLSAPRVTVDFNINLLDRRAFQESMIPAMLDQKIDAYMDRWNRTVSMKDLAALYADASPDNDLLYTFGDLESSWHNFYLRDHPGHGEMHKFYFEEPAFRR